MLITGGSIDQAWGAHIKHLHPLGNGGATTGPVTADFGQHYRPPPSNTDRIRKFAMIKLTSEWPEYQNLIPPGPTTDNLHFRGWDVCSYVNRFWVRLCRQTGKG